MPDSEAKIYNLRELREIFRARMLEENFCIGEEKVEKLFRELLNEPEPIEEPLNYEVTAKQREQFKQILEQESENIFKNVTKIFESDNMFYKHLKK